MTPTSTIGRNAPPPIVDPAPLSNRRTAPSDVVSTGDPDAGTIDRRGS